MEEFPWDAELSVLKPGKAWTNWDELVILFSTNIKTCQRLDERFYSKPVFTVARGNLFWVDILMGPSPTSKQQGLGSLVARHLGAQSLRDYAGPGMVFYLGLPGIGTVLQEMAAL